VTSLPPCSIVIATLDRPALLVDTVRSILAGTHVPEEIVIVDQSRRIDATVGTLVDDRPEVLTLVRMGGGGLTRARNAGAARARHDALVFVDDDMDADPRWLAALLVGLGGQDDRDVVTGRVVAGAPERPGAFVPSTAQELLRAEYRGRIDRDVLAGGNAALWRAALDEVGPWDERLGAGARYPAADDNDLGFRLLEAGYRIVYLPEALLYHRAWRPRWEYPVVRWRYGRGKAGFYMKHAGAADGHIQRRLKRDIGHRVRRLPRAVVRDPRLAAGDLAYLSGLLAGIAQWTLWERR
jgi:GT2 family glycosyltransferase